MSDIFADCLGNTRGFIFKCKDASCVCVGVCCNRKTRSSAICQQYICFVRIMNGCQATDDAFREIWRGLINSILGIIYRVWHRGALMGKRSTPVLTSRDLNLSIAGMNLMWIIMFRVSFTVQPLAHECVVCEVYWFAFLCVVFSCCGLPGATEQLVLTTIRQEASELQDPGQGTTVTMRACLADRFDKSEFAWIGLDDAPCVPYRCMRLWATARSRCLPTPGP